MENAWSGFNRAWSDHWIAVSTLPVFNAHAFIWIDTVQSLYLSSEKKKKKEEASSYQLLHSNYISISYTQYSFFKSKILIFFFFFWFRTKDLQIVWWNRKSLTRWAFFFFISKIEARS